MIPIPDQLQSRSYPVVTHGIIGLNVLVYLYKMMQGENIERFIYTYGLVPARYSVPEIAAHFSTAEQVMALLSFMFLHGGFFHLLGNMWSLYIFGDNVEDRMGPVRFLAFYLLCGWASGLAHLWSNWGSTVPTIGASGARVLTTLIYALKDHGLQRGLAALCLGGAEAVAMAIEIE